MAGFKTRGQQPLLVRFVESHTASETVTLEASVDDAAEHLDVLGYVEATVGEEPGTFAEELQLADVVLVWDEDSVGLDEPSLYYYETQAIVANWTDGGATGVNHDNDYPLQVASDGALANETRNAYLEFDLRGLDEFIPKGTTLTFEITTGTTLIILVLLDYEVFASATSPGVAGSTFAAPPTEGTLVAAGSQGQDLIGSTTVTFTVPPASVHGNFMLVKFTMEGLVTNNTTLTDSESLIYSGSGITEPTNTPPGISASALTWSGGIHTYAGSFFSSSGLSGNSGSTSTQPAADRDLLILGIVADVSSALGGTGVWNEIHSATSLGGTGSGGFGTLAYAISPGDDGDNPWSYTLSPAQNNYMIADRDLVRFGTGGAIESVVEVKTQIGGSTFPAVTAPGIGWLVVYIVQVGMSVSGTNYVAGSDSIPGSSWTFDPRATDVSNHNGQAPEVATMGDFLWAYEEAPAPGDHSGRSFNSSGLPTYTLTTMVLETAAT